MCVCLCVFVDGCQNQKVFYLQHSDCLENLPLSWWSSHQNRHSAMPTPSVIRRCWLCPRELCKHPRQKVGVEQDQGTLVSL